MFHELSITSIWRKYLARKVPGFMPNGAIKDPLGAEHYVTHLYCENAVEGGLDALVGEYDFSNTPCYFYNIPLRSFVCGRGRLLQIGYITRLQLYWLEIENPSGGDHGNLLVWASSNRQLAKNIIMYNEFVSASLPAGYRHLVIQGQWLLRYQNTVLRMHKLSLRKPGRLWNFFQSKLEDTALDDNGNFIFEVSDVTDQISSFCETGLWEREAPLYTLTLEAYVKDLKTPRWELIHDAPSDTAQ